MERGRFVGTLGFVTDGTRGAVMSHPTPSTAFSSEWGGYLAGCLPLG